MFKDGIISLQDIIDQLDPKEKICLSIYADCCYSGNWCKILEKKEVQTKGYSGISIYAACAHDEVATEGVFSRLLKGQLPDSSAFEKLWYLKGKQIGENQTLTYALNY